MASSHTPLLAPSHDDALANNSDYDDHDHDAGASGYEPQQEQTPFYTNLISNRPSLPPVSFPKVTLPAVSIPFPRAPSLPFTTAFHPTLLLRLLALILALPAFIIFIVVNGSRYAPAITFLAFAMTRQLAVLGTHVGSHIVVVRIEVVHDAWRSVGERAQERWFRQAAAAAIDGVVVLGLLIALAVIAREVDVCARRVDPCDLPSQVTHAVILGFITCGFLLLSISDFGNPNLVAVDVSAEEPVRGVTKFGASISFGEPEGRDEAETSEYRAAKRYGKFPSEDIA